MGWVRGSAVMVADKSHGVANSRERNLSEQEQTGMVVGIIPILHHQHALSDIIGARHRHATPHGHLSNDTQWRCNNNEPHIHSYCALYICPVVRTLTKRRARGWQCFAASQYRTPPELARRAGLFTAPKRKTTTVVITNQCALRFRYRTERR